MKRRAISSLRILYALAGLAAAVPLRAGYEIADVTDAGEETGFRGYTRVWLDYGTNPITPYAWENTFDPPFPPYVMNTPRNAEFNEENTFSSPGMPNGQVQVETIEGYTWKFIAQIQSAMWPFDSTTLPPYTDPYHAAFVTATPPKGAIKFSSNEKNQEMIFWARENNADEGTDNRILRYYITDEWGNKYILGASGAATDDLIQDSFDKAVLPAGWEKSTGYLDETLHLMPAYGAGNQAHYNLFRESADNSFFQIEWGESGHSIAEQIAGMPIWGGATGDNIYGRVGDDNLIHGAEGDDIIFVLGQNDTIFGDDGNDTVVLAGLFGDYTILSWADGGAELTLEGFGYTKTLYDVEILKFDDITIATAAIPEPSSMLLLLGGVAGLVCLTRQKDRSQP